jgi:hypothetical protein
MVSSDALALKVVDALASNVESGERPAPEFTPFKDDIAALQVHTIWLQKAVNKEEKYTEESQAQATKFREEADELRMEVDEMHAHLEEQRAVVEQHRKQAEADRKLKAKQDEETNRLRHYIERLENEAKMHKASLCFNLKEALRGPREEAAARMEQEEAKRASEQGKQAFEVAKNDAQMKDLQQMIEAAKADLQAQKERYAGNKLLNVLSLMQFKKRSNQHREDLTEQRQQFEQQIQQHHRQYEEDLEQLAAGFEGRTEEQAMQIQRENDAVAAEVQTLRERLEREKKRTAAATRRADARALRAKEAEEEALAAEAVALAESQARRAEMEDELLQNVQRPGALRPFLHSIRVETPRAAFPVLGALRHVEHQMTALSGLDVLGGLNAEIAALEAEMSRK